MQKQNCQQIFEPEEKVQELEQQVKDLNLSLQNKESDMEEKLTKLQTNNKQTGQELDQKREEVEALIVMLKQV